MKDFLFIRHFILSVVFSLSLIACGGGDGTGASNSSTGNTQQYQGDYTGTYSGTTSGSWSMTVAADGSASGKALTMASGDILLSGTFNSGGNQL